MMFLEDFKTVGVLDHQIFVQYLMIEILRILSLLVEVQYVKSLERGFASEDWELEHTLVGEKQLEQHAHNYELVGEVEQEVDQVEVGEDFVVDDVLDLLECLEPLDGEPVADSQGRGPCSG
jgi:hypothetical protein